MGIKKNNYFDLSIRQQRALWLLINRCKNLIQNQYNPDGFNVGININESAGQTVMHVHLIPRNKGDVVEPKGGVRGVMPEKREYSRLKL